ncbi:MAG: GNAT family protein [Dehalococcoidia bacterium]
MEPVTLVGRVVRLEPLRIDHAVGLLAVADAEIYRFNGTRPLEISEAGVREYVERVIERIPLPFAVIRDEQPIGVTCFFSVSERDRRIEIGGTWYGLAHWGSVVNPECKYLLMGYAFEEWGANRVEYHADLRNTRSRRAIEKLGAVQEGVLRHYNVMPDGFVRDVVVFGIVKAEWPVIKAGLEARLASFISPAGATDDATSASE